MVSWLFVCLFVCLSPKAAVPISADAFLFDEFTLQARALADGRPGSWANSLGFPLGPGS